jgi:hypothetical protein
VSALAINIHNNKSQLKNNKAKKEKTKSKIDFNAII